MLHEPVHHPRRGPVPAAEAPTLRDSYTHCGRIAAAHGKSYHLAARMLPRRRRPAVSALYAFARSVDDLVDLPPAGVSPGDLSRRLQDIDAAVADALAHDTDGRIPHMDRRVSSAFLDTARGYRLDPALFSAFLASMRMDIPGTAEHVAHYPTMATLDKYMHGSAAVIGLQMLPVLGAGEAAAEPAAALGVAFQMTNFLRDVGEDLDRGRIYLPLDGLAEFGVDAERLRAARRSGRPDAAVRAALAHFAERAHEHYRRAEPGAAMLAPRQRMCVRAATAVYAEILTTIERSSFRVFDRRTVVPPARRFLLAASAACRPHRGAGDVGAPVRTPSPAPASPPHARDLPAARRRGGRAATDRR
ncbi:phytoene/squalene synthase family protein [Tomitella gaofuii]|uniref:phytoene/squalene synthase family protein n=1 Tax=Tomitella gaofuii TaxID=2760083 RepID=UPI002E2DBD9A|nr:phytoene/squalene synthase family protein [Tomitella gaofuii]